MHIAHRLPHLPVEWPVPRMDKASAPDIGGCPSTRLISFPTLATAEHIFFKARSASRIANQTKKNLRFCRETSTIHIILHRRVIKSHQWYKAYSQQVCAVARDLAPVLEHCSALCFARSDSTYTRMYTRRLAFDIVCLRIQDGCLVVS